MEMKSRLFDRVIFRVGIEYQGFYHDVNGNVLLVRFYSQISNIACYPTCSSSCIDMHQSFKSIKSSTSFRYA